MSTVPKAIRNSVAMSVVLRPIRSPKCPKMAAPTGRATKPTNWVANAARTPAKAFWPGKNSCGNTSAAAVP